MSVKLEEKHVSEASTYLPLALKSALAKVLAPGCIERQEADPLLWQEKIIGRKLVELYVLTGYYLKITDVSALEGEDPKFNFSLEQYDELAAAYHQLEDMAGDKRAKGILRDFLDWVEMLDMEIKNQLAAKNDILARMGGLLEVGAIPEAYEALRQAAQEVKEDGEAP